VRPLFLLLGAGLIAVGIALLFVPVLAQPTETIPARHGPANFYIEHLPGASLTGTIPATISWSSDVAVTVVGGACAAACTNDSELSDVVVQRGLSGTFAVVQPDGGSIFLGANTSAPIPATVTFHATAAFVTLGSLLAVGGLVVVALAFVWQKRSPDPAPPPAPGAVGPPPVTEPTRSADSDHPSGYGRGTGPDPPGSS
jgi:hypothetical protein